MSQKIDSDLKVSEDREFQESEKDLGSDFFSTRDLSVHCEISIKERIQILLLRLGKSQNWLAREVGVNEGTMSKIVNGKWNPTANVKIRLGRVLQCDSLVLFGATPFWTEYEKKFREVRNVEN